MRDPNERVALLLFDQHFWHNHFKKRNGFFLCYVMTKSSALYTFELFEKCHNITVSDVVYCMILHSVMQ